MLSSLKYNSNPHNITGKEVKCSDIETSVIKGAASKIILLKVGCRIISWLACRLCHFTERGGTDRGSWMSEINSKYKGGWPDQVDITRNLGEKELREFCHFRIHNNQIKYCWTCLYPCPPFEWFYSIRNIYQVPTVWSICLFTRVVSVCVYLGVSVVVCVERYQNLLLPQIHCSCQFKGITLMMITSMSLGLTSKLLAKDFRLCGCSRNTHTHTLLEVFRKWPNSRNLQIFFKREIWIFSCHEIGSVSQVYLYIW